MKSKKSFFALIATAVVLLISCEKETPQNDSTIYGNIEMINASDPSIALGRMTLRFGVIDFKKGLSETGWTDFRDSLINRGENLDLDFIGSLDFDIDSLMCHSYKVYTFGDNDYNLIILYIHGGGYGLNAIENHFKICNSLASMDGNIKVVMPIYPLTPQHTWQDSYDLMDELYANLLKEGKPIVIMGDSAGGGFACAYTQYLYKMGKPLPYKRVLISPWLDVTFANPEAAEIESRDAMLCIYGLLELGKMWKGDLDAKDYRISPLYGELNDGVPTLITVGTNEIMLPDCNTLYNTLVASKCHTTILYGVGLWHIFPTFDISEGIAVRQRIIKFIRDN